MIKALTACLLTAVFVTGPAVYAGGHEQADKPAAIAGERSARIAGGQTVKLADSAKSNKEWAEGRRNYNDLKPKKR
jgi:hypothetical protein